MYFLRKRERLLPKMPEVTYTPSLPIEQAFLLSFVNGSGAVCMGGLKA